jgi:uncharacterized membrane protein YgcG
MKSVTEFWAISLNQGLTKKAALDAEGKTPEEVSAALGEQLKMEGEKLTHFINAMEVASQNPEKLSRVRVVTLAEGENAPQKALQVEAHHYVPEFQTAPRPAQAKKAEAGGKGGRSGGGGGGGRGGGGHGGKTKTSPWGLTPEEKAAKKQSGKAPKHNTGY